MAIRIRCSCGARLEFDEAFAGQTIPCPDCSASLVVEATPANREKTSPAVLIGFLASIVGFFTVIGSLLGIGLGWWAQRRAASSGGDVSSGHAGTGLARAAVVLGFLGIGTTAAAMLFLDRLGIDGWLRTVEWAGKLDYDLKVKEGEDPLSVVATRGERFPIVHLVRPSRYWGRMPVPRDLENLADDLILFHVADDAHISCLIRNLDRDIDLDTCRTEGLRLFLDSQLVAFLSGRMTRSSTANPEMRERKQLPGTEVQEFRIDLTLAGRERSFLLRIHTYRGFLVVLAGGCRKERFEDLEPSLRKALDGVRIEN